MYLNKVIEKTPFKRSIDDLDLFDLPMVGIFKDKRFAAYTLSTLAGIEVDDLDEMDVAVEDFLSNAEEGRRDMRMDARINIRKGEVLETTDFNQKMTTDFNQYKCHRI